MNDDASYWIQKLDLQPHPEGGFYRVTYSSELKIPCEGLPREFPSPRPVATAIYFLIDSPQNFSALHRIQSDEMWHFYAGSPLSIHVIDPQGSYSQVHLGHGWLPGHVFQAVVKAKTWFGASLAEGGSFALVGCTVAPGFDFEDFELANRRDLMTRYPQHASIIEKLTRVSEPEVA